MMPHAVPTRDEVVADLRQVRVLGLVRLRTAVVPALAALASSRVGGSSPADLEEMLRQAVALLDSVRLRSAAEHTFGLLPGDRDKAAQDRRKAAARSYSVGVDRFRKHYEPIVLDQVAEVIALWPDVLTDTGVAEWLASPVVLRVRVDAAVHLVQVHCTSIDLIRGVDIVVNPTNTYMELAGVYKKSVAATLRWAGAPKDAEEGILVDSVADALREWRVTHGVTGQVVPGTVAGTSVDPAAELAYRRIYHAAIAQPRVGTNEYHVALSVLERAVRNVFALARAERDRHVPSLSSICFPLLGAGRGGLDPAQSFLRIWQTVQEELRGDGDWQIHFAAVHPREADLIKRGLSSAA
ncbi:hypothetical protein QEZ54_17870 [Catellatospora sp. KI3]|uniref:macro domain-containing protein n=1 Tax=Catellatospora sp. KI3 TaxID=3041620 RepID=UPI0024824ABB|nr:hypothetical protein [Catellatospora sp. KI3]MDI1462847.1 hypothetical protein [Catellatospora sp. KI3]